MQYDNVQAASDAVVPRLGERQAPWQAPPPAPHRVTSKTSSQPSPLTSERLLLLVGQPLTRGTLRHGARPSHEVRAAPLGVSSATTHRRISTCTSRAAIKLR